MCFLKVKTKAVLLYKCLESFQVHRGELKIMCVGRQFWMKTVDQFLSHWKETTSFMPKMHNMYLIMRKPQEKNPIK